MPIYGVLCLPRSVIQCRHWTFGYYTTTWCRGNKNQSDWLATWWEDAKLPEIPFGKHGHVTIRIFLKVEAYCFSSQTKDAASERLPPFYKETVVKDAHPRDILVPLNFIMVLE